MGSLISLLRSMRFRLSMKGILDLSIVIDREGGHVVDRGGGDDSGDVLEVIYFIDLINVARRGAKRTVDEITRVKAQ